MSKQVKPKILIVADRPNWAYHLIQQFIISNLSDNFDFYTDFILFYPLKTNDTVKQRLAKWYAYSKSISQRKLLKKNTYDITLHLGYYYNWTSSIQNNTRSLIRGIYTDGFPPQLADLSNTDGSINQFVSKYLSDSDAVVCGSQSILNLYSSYVSNIHFANLSWECLFHRKLPKTINTSENFIVGWTGNPNRKFKGFYDYVVPSVQEAMKLRPGIKLKTRFSGPIRTLPLFYNDVDIVLIASIADAGPSMFSEAAFCEVPSVSTEVGHPKDIIIDGINGVLVERNITAMRNALIKLYDNRTLLYKLSTQIKIDITKILGSNEMKEAWKLLFQSTL